MCLVKKHLENVTSGMFPHQRYFTNYLCVGHVNVILSIISLLCQEPCLTIYRMDSIWEKGWDQKYNNMFFWFWSIWCCQKWSNPLAATQTKGCHLKNAPLWMCIVSRGARGEGGGAICSGSGAECGNMCCVVVTACVGEESEKEFTCDQSLAMCGN